MPKTKLADHVKLMKNPRRPIVETIAGRLDTSDITREELAQAMGVTTMTVSNRLRQPIEQWRYGEIIAACRLLSITSEELREMVRV